MMILLSKNKELIKHLKEDMENLEIVDNILDCQLFLDKQDCDLLTIDWQLVEPNIKGFVDWIVKTDPFIKYILFYYTDHSEKTLKENHSIVQSLKKVKYKVNCIHLNNLFQGLKNYEQ